MERESRVPERCANKYPPLKLDVLVKTIANQVANTEEQKTKRKTVVRIKMK